MRTFLVAGNWKMHGSLAQVSQLLRAIKAEQSSFSHVEVAVLPTFLHLTEAAHLLKHSAIKLGAQNLHTGTEGAFTGEISGPMLKEIGCEYVLVGHSERRTLFHEDLALITLKFKAAQEASLTPILCIGETRSDRENQLTEQVIRQQLMSVIDEVGIEAFERAVVAYEPVWAIGTGLTATPEEAEEVHAFIRELCVQKNVDIGRALRILYGGSVKAENAASLFQCPNIDGGLIGGASLQAKGFVQICASAEQAQVAA